MDEGEIVEQNEPEPFFSNPQSERTQLFLSQILDAAPMVVAIIDSDRRPLLDNLAYKALLGDLRGREPADLFLDALKQQIGFEIGRPGRQGDAFTNVDVRLDLPGAVDPRWFACSGVCIGDLDDAARSFFRSKADRDRSCLLLIANEITERRNRIIEARMNMIRANIDEQQMIQTMREAISGALFKMQAPLNMVKASMNMASRGGDCTGRMRILEQVLSTGEEAMATLQKALPNPRTEESSSVNVNELLHEVLRLSTKKLLAAGVVVDLRPATVLPPLVGRANSLRALFRYLIDNAIQAVSESGREYREIRIQTRTDGSDIVIEVMDNGLGIPETTSFKVFEPFYCDWTKRRNHAGMGLTLAQEVAIAHDGSIDIDSDFIGGCRVYVRLPHADDDRCVS
jgi:nitrogen fixation regulatory protein